MNSFMQIFGRLYALFVGIRHAEDKLILVPLIPWALSDIIRYTYYSLNIFGMKSEFITWLRYTAFVILYPIGYGGEILNVLRRIQ